MPRKQNKEPQTRRTLTTSLVPNKAWFDINKDSIEWLPLSQRYSVVMVVIDQFGKYSHFIPLAHLYTATIVAKKFLDNIFKLHGIPQSIVSDKDAIFTSFFGKKFSV